MQTIASNFRGQISRRCGHEQLPFFVSPLGKEWEASVLKVSIIDCFSVLIAVQSADLISEAEENMLTNSDLIELTEFRRYLHRRPEVSGEEVETAETNVAALKLMYPMQILTGLDGHGVAAIFDSGNDGPTVLFRAELDALPIQERNDSIDWPSDDSGKSHVCGYDGHMTMLLGLGRMMSRQAVARGRVVLASAAVD